MNRIVIDTETCGGFAKPLVYDLGYVIANEDGEILKARSYVIKETYDDEEKFETAYYKWKRPMYEERIKSGYSKKVYLAYALMQLINDMERFGIDKFAYNSRFDNRAIMCTMEEYGKTKYNPLEKKEIADIMDYIAVITDSQDYKNFCTSNGFMTNHKTPRPQKKAETLYRYITNNPNYEEEHTALEDSKIELAILSKVLWLVEED